MSAAEGTWRRDYHWVYLDEATAKRHPLYGVRGWARLLLVVLICAPLFPLLSTCAFAGIAPPLALFFGVAFLVSAAANWWLALLLNDRDSRFQKHYAIITGVLTLLSFLGSSNASALALTVVYAVLQLGGIGYVLESRRINVTTRRRVRPKDAFLKHEGASPTQA